MNRDIAHLRKDYVRDTFDVSEALPDPIAQFSAWFDAARATEAEPTAMTLATVEHDRPAARIVLLKDYDARGFCFYTNQTSRKGRELAHNPRAALLFFWGTREQQVRIEGRIEVVEADAADAYYASRPLDSRLGAWASPQSQVIADRDVLSTRFAEAQARYGDQPPRPPHWGGYRVIPDYFEFWQGRANRLHDRIAYRPDGEAKPEIWVRQRLAP